MRDKFAPHGRRGGSPRRNVKRFRGGLVCKARRLVNHSTLGSRVVKKQKHRMVAGEVPEVWRAAGRSSPFECAQYGGLLGPARRGKKYLDHIHKRHVIEQDKYVH